MILTCGPQGTADKGITLVSRITNTVWIVIPHGARGVAATNSRTRVFALLRDTSQVRGTLLVDCALRFALNIGISPKTRKTLTRGCSCPLIANCIDATRRRITRVDNFRSWWLGCDPIASVEGVSLVPLVANTDGNMISHSAICIDSTKSRTRILTASVDAGELF